MFGAATRKLCRCPNRTVHKQSVSSGWLGD